MVQKRIDGDRITQDLGLNSNVFGHFRHLSRLMVQRAFSIMHLHTFIFTRPPAIHLLLVQFWLKRFSLTTLLIT